MLFMVTIYINIVVFIDFYNSVDGIDRVIYAEIVQKAYCSNEYLNYIPSNERMKIFLNI